MVILAALALAGAGLVVYAIQTERLDEAVNSALSQEVAEFEQRERLGDPDTGITYDSAIDLMTAALNSNVPSEDELIIAVWNDKMQLTLPGDHRELTSNSEFQSAVMAMAPAGGVRDVSTSYGDVRVAVKPVRDAETAGAMVFAYYLDDVRNDLRDLLRTYAVVAGLVVVAVAIGAYVVAGRLLRPVRDLRDTAREISESDLTNRITASGNDDLTDLTVTFNAMLDRLDEAFTTQRQFLDDVGHELKTPITIVRGHLELMRENDLAEVDATRQLVLDEMDRMARLVEELILLAKSRRPGFLRLEQTDVGLLTTGLFDKVRALAKRDWRLGSVAQGQTALDGQRVTQAVIQLASNAVRHTSDDDVISIGSRLDPESLSLWVIDTGAGIPPDVQREIFERFKRGTDTGDGSGLGLAIVAAIAQAHHGDVLVESSPGEGARFEIKIPRKRLW